MSAQNSRAGGCRARVGGRVLNVQRCQRDRSREPRVLEGGRDLEKFTRYCLALAFLATLIATLSIARVEASEDLFDASARGDVTRIRTLLRPGVSPDVTDVQGRTPLMVAAFNGHTGAVDALLESGANANALTRQWDTALMAAAFRGHLDVVRRLLRDYANPSQFNRDGQTAADIARAKGHHAIVKALEEAANSPPWRR